MGLTVTAGIWLGHEQHGFQYNNADMVAKQYDGARKTILRYKDHPALLMWGLGNEMEGTEKGDNAAIWSAVNDLARLAHTLDPNHPTMTVIAEVGGDRLKNIHQLCPDIDIVGVNSYGGAPSLPGRYRAAGGVKPYVLTEFGPPGQWESGKTAWGAATELTSTEKAEVYRRVYQDAVLGSKGLCLGSYAFTWGHKHEATATWFGLLLPDGHRTAAVDALSELWTGKPPANHAPKILGFRLDGPERVEPGASARAALKTADPEKDPLTIRWVLQAEGTYGSGGDAEAVPPVFPEAIVSSDATKAELKMPRKAGGYRLYAYVEDPHGGAAVANIPILVEAAKSVSSAKSATLPLVVYDEPSRAALPYVPSGFMGNTKAIKMDEQWREHPHSGKTCVRVDYRESRDWGGVVWQNPANDWGDQPGGFDLSGAKRLTFWARGDRGGEVVSFEIGLLKRDKPFFDTDNAKLEAVKLGTTWKQYSIRLADKDLKRIKTGFSWVVAADGKPITFYLDDIRYE